MRIPVFFLLAVRSFFYRRREYSSLFFACFFGVGVALFALSVNRGMILSLADKARIYYGGDYCVLGGESSLTLPLVDEYVPKVEAAFEKCSIPFKISKRFDYNAFDSAFFFEGAEAHQRVIKGVDFQKERNLLERLSFVQGSLPKENGAFVILPLPAARTLGCVVGDEITLLLEDSDGYLNTASFVVSGIYRDSSVFGMYTSYADFSTLVSAYSMPNSWANRICIDTFAKNATEKTALLLQNALIDEGFRMFPLVDDKRDFYDVLLSKGFSEPTLALIPLSANLSDVRIMERAMKMVSFCVIFLLILIIVSGVGSTWRVIVIRRLVEIGTYRSLGMKRHTLLFSLLSEAAFLIFLGSSFGVVFCLIAEKIISLFDFSMIPSFDIFLTQGVIVPVTDWSGGAIIIALVLLSTLFVAFWSVRKTVKMMPAAALSAGEAL
mgnify:CR=1 FL=1